MECKTIEIHYLEYSDKAQLPASDAALLHKAWEMTAASYAPYSAFHVGAAVRMASGKVFGGSNQENAAFPSGLCAERTAMFSAGARYPDKDMESIALAGGVMGRLAHEPATPCGACRQVMAQYQAWLLPAVPADRQ